MMGDEDVFETPDYPAEWDSQQRIAAYWHAVYHTGMPAREKDWHAVGRSLQREIERRGGIR